MKVFQKLLAFFLVIQALDPAAQNAPVTTAATVISPGPGVTVPVTVTGFTDIGAISLTLDYDYSVVQATGVIPNAGLPGFTADWNTIPGRIVMGWYGSTGVNLPDEAVLLNITFTGLTGGETVLHWFDNGPSCEYAKYDNGSFTPLSDIPNSGFYGDGLITFWRHAPQTIAPVFPAEPNTDICIPITVNQFSNIGSISLTMDYDPAILTFNGFNPVSIPSTGWSFDVQSTIEGRMIAGGFGPAFGLPDGSVLFEACFIYHGGTSLLTWNDANGSACEYADGLTLQPLYDQPQPDYYLDGVVTGTLCANFTANTTTPPVNAPVSLTDMSTGGPTSWTWTIDRPTYVFMNGTNEHSQNPQVGFTDGGMYTLTLLVQNTWCSDPEIKVNYIHAGTPGLWNGEFSQDWYDNKNWDNHSVPDNLVDVLIPAGCLFWPYWPTSNGDFVIGNECKTLTLDPDSQMTVDGNLVVN